MYIVRPANYIQIHPESSISICVCATFSSSTRTVVVCLSCRPGESWSWRTLPPDWRTRRGTEHRCSLRPSRWERRPHGPGSAGERCGDCWPEVGLEKCILLTFSTPNATVKLYKFKVFRWGEDGVCGRKQFTVSWDFIIGDIHFLLVTMRTHVGPKKGAHG